MTTGPGEVARHACRQIRVSTGAPSTAGTATATMKSRLRVAVDASPNAKMNAEFLRFAAHWEFVPRSCPPYCARTNGKVERPIHYLGESFFDGRAFANDADLNAQTPARVAPLPDDAP